MRSFLKESGKLLANGIELCAQGANALADAADELSKKAEILRAENAVNCQLRMIDLKQGESPKAIVKEYEVLIDLLNNLLILKPDDFESITEQLDNAKKEMELCERRRYTVHDEYNPEGELNKRIRRKDGLLHGACDAWYPGGEKMWTASFVKGKPVGYANIWHRNGKLRAQIIFNPEIKRWELTRWYDDGKILSEEKYYEANKVLLIKIRLNNGICLGNLKYIDGKRKSNHYLAVIKKLFDIKFWKLSKDEKEIERLLGVFQEEYEESAKITKDIFSMS